MPSDDDVDVVIGASYIRRPGYAGRVARGDDQSRVLTCGEIRQYRSRRRARAELAHCVAQQRRPPLDLTVEVPWDHVLVFGPPILTDVHRAVASDSDDLARSQFADALVS